MKAYLVSKEKCGLVEINDKLQEYYDVIDCRCIDIVERKIGGKYFDIICDDEGLLKESPIPSMIDKKGNVMMVGNLIICHHDSEGNMTSLEDGDEELIKDNIVYVFYRGQFIRIIKGEY